MNHQSTYRLHAIAIILIVGSLAALLAGCGHGASGNAQRYDLQGTVVSVDARGETVTIAHGEIPGYMEAMTMPFKPKDRWVLDEAKPGNHIQATLVVDGLRSWLENVVLTAEATDNTAPAASAAEPQAGAEVPDFTLTNQDGKRVALRDYRGQALVITFIYTRCPLPDYCPLMTDHFAEIVRQIKSDAALYDKSRLLSITVDPEYDTPAVLREYGAKHTGESGAAMFSHWQFATGKADEIKQVAAWFGLQYWPAGEQVVHSLRTAVIAPDGRLVKIYRGNDWRPADIVADLKALKPASSPQSVKEASLQKEKSTASASPSLEKTEAAKLYHAVGVVESLGDAHTTVQINHEDIKDLMPAMSMSFEVQSATMLDHIAPGDRVSFTLQETPHGLVIIELRKR
jgi:protein SCO1/2